MWKLEGFNSFLSTDAASAATTLTVQSIIDFDTDQILCIGEIGNEDLPDWLKEKIK